MLYNKDKEKVIIGSKSDTATLYLVLAPQQNLKRFPALVGRFGLENLIGQFSSIVFSCMIGFVLYVWFGLFCSESVAS